MLPPIPAVIHVRQRREAAEPALTRSAARCRQWSSSVVVVVERVVVWASGVRVCCSLDIVCEPSGLVVETEELELLPLEPLR